MEHRLHLLTVFLHQWMDGWCWNDNIQTLIFPLLAWLIRHEKSIINIRYLAYILMDTQELYCILHKGENCTAAMWLLWFFIQIYSRQLVIHQYAYREFLCVKSELVTFRLTISIELMVHCKLDLYIDTDISRHIVFKYKMYGSYVLGYIVFWENIFLINNILSNSWI